MWIRWIFAFLALATSTVPSHASSMQYKAWLQSHATILSRDANAPLRFPKELKDTRLILVGEVHGIAHGQQADLVLLKTLHAQAGVRHYVGEFDAAQADAFNQLLDTGDTAAMDAVFAGWRSRGLQWANADFRQKLVSIAEWNRGLRPRDRIRFVGADEIQDRPAYCRWLANRIKIVAVDSELSNFKSVLDDPARCKNAGGLAELALKHASQLDAVTVDGIAAFATDAATSDREEKIAANIHRNMKKLRGRFYGLWGLYHVVKAEVNGTAPMALQLLRKGIALRSIAILNLDGKMMFPAQQPDGKIAFGEIPYSVNDANIVTVNGIEPFAETATSAMTLFTFSGRNSPFQKSDVLTRVGGKLGRMQPFAVDPATAPTGYWVDAVLISRGSPATRPLD